MILLTAYSVDELSVIKTSSIIYLFEGCLFKIYILINYQLNYKLKSLKSRIIGKFVMQVIDSITDIQAELNSANLASENLPPTLSHELIKLEFTFIIFNHVDQFWSEEMIDELECQHIACYSNINVISH